MYVCMHVTGPFAAANKHQTLVPFFFFSPDVGVLGSEPHQAGFAAVPLIIEPSSQLWFRIFKSWLYTVFSLLFFPLLHFRE